MDLIDIDLVKSGINESLPLLPVAKDISVFKYTVKINLRLLAKASCPSDPLALHAQLLGGALAALHH